MPGFLVLALEDYYGGDAKKNLQYYEPDASPVKHNFNHHDIGLPKQEVAVCEDSEAREQDHHVHFLVNLGFVTAHPHVNTCCAKENENDQDGNFYKELALGIAELVQLEEKQCESDHDDDAAKILVVVK